ncbi:MAG: hypothetical protein V1817_03630 [Candidatus Micrarchaeota archaeon]
MVDAKISGAAVAGGGDALPFGPWKILYSGVWAGHKSSVFVNPERVLVLLVNDDAPATGALVLLKKTFVLDGDSRELVAFLNSQKRSFSVIEKIGRAGRIKFLVLDGEPTYAANATRDFADILRSQYQALNGVSKSLLEVAESYKTGVTELAKTSFDTADMLLGDPLFLAAAKPDAKSTGAVGVEAARVPTTEKSGAAAREKNEEKPERLALLGLNSNREPLEIDLNSFQRATVVSKDAKQSNHLLQTIAESALLNGVSCLVFASSDALHGLGEAAESRDDYDYFRMNGDSHGFPLNEFSLNTLKIDLSNITADDFVDALGLRDAEFAEAIRAAFDAGGGKAHDLIALTQALEKTDVALFPPSAREKAVRVMRCLEREFPHSFGENKPPLFENALAAARNKNLAGVLWLDASDAPPILKQLHYCSAAALAARVFSASAGSVGFLFICDEDASQIGEAARRALGRASAAGVGFCVRSEYSSEASGIHATLCFEILGGDAFALREGAKTKFSVRPTYSRSIDKATRMAGKPGFFALPAKLEQFAPQLEQKDAPKQKQGQTEKNSAVTKFLSGFRSGGKAGGKPSETKLSEAKPAAQAQAENETKKTEKTVEEEEFIP